MDMQQGARIIVENWLHAQPEDMLHFITDETKLPEAGAFTKAAHAVGAIPSSSVPIAVISVVVGIVYALLFDAAMKRKYAVKGGK